MSVELVTALGALGVAVPTPASGSTGEMAFTPPTTATFATTRSGSSGAGTVANMSGGRGVRLTAPFTSSNTNSLTYAVRACTPGGTGGWSATGRFRVHAGLVSAYMGGMILRNSASGKSRMCWHGKDSLSGFNFNNYSSDDAWASVLGGVTWDDQEWWQRIRFDGTTVTYEVSKDGDFWLRITNEVMSGIYPGTPDQIGIAINPNGIGTSVTNTFAMDCLSWSFTSL